MTQEPSPFVGPPVPTAEPPRRRGVILAAALVAVAAASAGGYYVLTRDPDREPRLKAAVIPVNTVTPARTTLVRTLEQPGSILPEAEAELYAKTSGYLRLLRREVSPEVAAALLLAPRGLWGLAGVAVALDRAPVIDIGSRVRAGDVLAEIDVPERRQDVVEREALAAQRAEEVAQAQTAIGTYQAAVESAKAHQAQAEADIKRYQSEHALRRKELARIKDLVRRGALEERLQDEKEAQVGAALSAWESSQAKAKAAAADLSLATSKLATARADVRVKQAQLAVARADVERARIVESYASLHAPFDGTVTYRAADEGDFVQNSRTGQ